jgi:tRNA threonylcarbamoyladenosine biosynthesis protein TsaB
MNAIISIDTTSNEKITIGIIIEGKKHIIDQKLDRQKAQVVLPLIEKILKDKKLKLNDITEVIVNPGPGSFTGIRVGLTVANTLAFLLKIPVNGKPIGELEDPNYSS